MTMKKRDMKNDIPCTTPGEINLLQNLLTKLQYNYPGPI